MKPNIQEIPTDPGCYLYKSNNGMILYVGKAKNLRKRVSSYFQKKDHDPKTKALVSHIKEIDFIVTNNEVEALLLENTLIKKHTPRFNIDLKDSKRYAFIKLTKEKVPKLTVARKKDDSGEYYGPFVSGSERDYIFRSINRIFKLRTCKTLPKKVCLRYHIGACTGPCEKKVSIEEYQKQIDSARMVLRGKTKELLKKLQQEMKVYSKNEDYERAIEVRNQIQSLEYLQEAQTVERKRDYNEDIINYVKRGDNVYLFVFKVYQGTLDTKEEYVFPETIDFLEEFLIQYYSEHSVPREIILPEIVDPLLKQFLEVRRKKKVHIITPKIGDKKTLLDLVKKNIEAQFFSEDEKLEALQKLVHLVNPPKIIECFDISHLSGTSTVASMVQFRGGKPYKQQYRRFKIRSVDYIDDFMSMSEVVRRRYERLLKEQAELPDLIIIDGGKGQLTSAIRELEKLSLKIPIISIAKRLEEIYTPEKEKPILTSRKNKGLQLVQQIRDEAHRFAITYNKLLRKKATFEK